MPHTCTTCEHPDLEEVDQALLANEPLRRIGARFGLSASSLWRHKRNHLGRRAVENDLAGRVEKLEHRVELHHRALVKLLAVLMGQKGVLK